MTWAHRMDHYYKIENTAIYWLQISVSTAVVTCLTILFFLIFKGGLDKDLMNLHKEALARAERRKKRATQMEIVSSEEPSERHESAVAWKKLYGHVWKAPAYPAVFSCLLGAGTQVFMMSYFVLNAFYFFFSVQTLRPPLFWIIMSVLAGMGFLNGLVTTRVYKFFGCTEWLEAAVHSSIAFPLFIYCCLGAENVLYALQGGYNHTSLLF